MWTSFISNALWIRNTKCHHYVQIQGLLITCKHFIKRVMYTHQSSYLLQPSLIKTKIIQKISLKNHILHIKYWGSLCQICWHISHYRANAFWIFSTCSVQDDHKVLSTANACKIFIFLSWQSRISSRFCFKFE